MAYHSLAKRILLGPRSCLFRPDSIGQGCLNFSALQYLIGYSASGERKREIYASRPLVCHLGTGARSVEVAGQAVDSSPPLDALDGLFSGAAICVP